MEIEQLKVGDWVEVYDPWTGERYIGTVYRFATIVNDDMIEVKRDLNDELYSLQLCSNQLITLIGTEKDVMLWKLQH